MSRPRKLTEEQEARLLEEYEMRKNLGLKVLCAKYDISRRSMLYAIERARTARANKRLAAS